MQQSSNACRMASSSSASFGSTVPDRDRGNNGPVQQLSGAQLANNVSTTPHVMTDSLSNLDDTVMMPSPPLKAPLVSAETLDEET